MDPMTSYLLTSGLSTLISPKTLQGFTSFFSDVVSARNSGLSVLMSPKTLQGFTSFFSDVVSSARNADSQIAANAALEKRRQTLSKEIALFQAEVQPDIANTNLAFQIARLQKEQALQRELAELNSARQLEIAKMQRETTLKMAEVNTLFANWPLRIVPSQILNAYPRKQPQPLRVLLSPPLVEFDKFIHPNPQIQQSNAGNFPRLEKRLAESLRELLNVHYPQTSDVRPVELLDGAWDSARYFGNASVRALYSMLQSEPVIVLDSEVDGDFLNFRVAYWGLAQETYTYQPILSRFPYREVLYTAAKARALKWKVDVRDKLLAKGKKLKEINEKYGGDNAANLAILEEDEEMRREGIEIERHYCISQADWEILCQVLSAYHAVTLGVIADGHFLLHHDTPPLFMQLLPQWLTTPIGVARDKLVQWVVDRYEEMLQALAQERAYRVPLLRLELATHLAKVPALELAERQVVLAVQQYFAGRLANKAEFLSELLTACLPVIVPSDAEFLTPLQACLRVLGWEEWTGRIAVRHDEVKRLMAELAQMEIEKQKQAEEERKRRKEAEKGTPFTFETVIQDTLSAVNRIFFDK